jgi:hypothetical protein
MSLFPSEKSYTYFDMGPVYGWAVYASPMAHAKDKGASKNVKKKAAKGIKEKRAEKRLKHDTRRQTGAVEILSDR